MDALSDLLRAVQLSGAVFLNGDFKAPWCLISEADSSLRAAFLPGTGPVVSYHLITEGSCWARLADGDGQGLRVDAGELLVVPQGEPHVLGSDLHLSPIPAGPLVAGMMESNPGEVMRVSYGGAGTPTRMVCGFLAFDDMLGNPLLSSLPRLFKVGLDRGVESAWLVSALAFATSEAAEPRAGSATVLAKLSELLFVQAVRRCIDGMPESERGWLAALRDRYVGRALSRMHARPAYPWTVDELAGSVGLSRSALAQRFTDLLGQPPMQYLAHWRLRIAATALRNGSQSIGEVAGIVGYDSEAAFCRAFKREFGLPPASWRRHRIDPAPQAPEATTAQ